MGSSAGCRIYKRRCDVPAVRNVYCFAVAGDALARLGVNDKPACRLAVVMRV
jgi:hypothetical protein